VTTTDEAWDSGTLPPQDPETTEDAVQLTPESGQLPSVQEDLVRTVSGPCNCEEDA
jgi:hypothetical protein